MSDQPLPRVLTWAHLRNKHPEYDAGYWKECRALLTGGRRLLRDSSVLADLLPQHPNEEEDVYRERVKRAVYVPTPGEIVGDLAGMLAQDPVAPAADPDPDPFYADVFFEDVDRKGLTLTAYVQKMMREALTVRCAWALVDLPTPEEGEAPESLAEEEEGGLLRAWATPLEAESVIDWEENDEGELLWACVHHCSRRRTSPGARRDTIVEVFTFYSECEWVRFEVAYEEGKAPKDKDEFTAVDGGDHSFGEVPLVRLELPDGLWALDKMHSLARAALNQRSALSYSQNKGLFPILTAFLGPEMGGGGSVPAEAQQAPTRATDQTYGIGRVSVFGKDDDLRYVSPDAGIFTFAASDLDKLRDDMHRVTATMAASIDNSPSAVGRSGESKAQDKSDRELVLQALGVIACDHVSDLLELVGRGRKDPPVTWSIGGLRAFDQMGADEAIAQAQIVEGLTIPSATFHRVYRTALAKRIVAHDATQEQLDDIAKEIDANTTEEEVNPPPPPLIDPTTGLPMPQGTPAKPPQGPQGARKPPAPGAPPKKAPAAPVAPPRGAPAAKKPAPKK